MGQQRSFRSVDPSAGVSAGVIARGDSQECPVNCANLPRVPPPILCPPPPTTPHRHLYHDNHSELNGALRLGMAGCLLSASESISIQISTHELGQSPFWTALQLRNFISHCIPNLELLKFAEARQESIEVSCNKRLKQVGVVVEDSGSACGSGRFGSAECCR